MTNRLFNRQAVPWMILTAVLAVALTVMLLMKRGRGEAPNSNEINGVVQDSSGRRVTAWLDPMCSQGPPHIYKSNKPGHAPDCGMRLVPLYADEATTSTRVPSNVSGYSNVSLSTARQQLIGVKLATAEPRALAGGIRTIGIV